MSQKKEIYISLNNTKYQFSMISLIIAIFSLIILFISELTNTYIKYSPLQKTSVIGVGNINVAINLSSVIVAYILAYILISMFGKIKIKDFNRPAQIKMLDIIYKSIFLIATSLLIIYFINIINTFFSINITILHPIGFGIENNYFNNYVYIIGFIFVSAFLEEMLFRGYLLRFFGRFGNFFALVVISIIYSLFNPEITTIPISIFLSIYLSKITLKYKSIQPTIIIRVLFNLFYFIYYYFINTHSEILIALMTILNILYIYIIFGKKITSINVLKNENTYSLIKTYLFSIPTIMLFIILIFNIFVHYLLK